MKTIVVVGAGGNAREVAGIIRDIGAYSFLGFVADRNGQHDSPLLGDFGWLSHHQVECLAMGIGNPRAKLEISHKLKRQYPDIAWPKLVHPTAYVGPTCQLEEGIIVEDG